MDDKFWIRNYEVENKIAELRKAKGLTQEELADILGYSIYCLRAIERGAAQPTIRSAYVFCEFFNKKLEEIFILKKREGKE